MSSSSNKDMAVDLAKFAGTIKSRGMGFQHIVRIVITVSVFLAVIMISIK